VVAKALKKFLKRAPNTMAKFYRQTSVVGLRELLRVFDCQKVPTDLLDYEGFKERHNGREEAEILKSLENPTANIILPQIVYTAHTSAFYSPLNQFAETVQSAVGIGFKTPDYRDENEIVWIAAEIDSKLEASGKLTEFWCDRLEMVALMCNFAKYKIWLVAPEGFSPEAIEILKQRNAYGSNRKQVNLLIKLLKAEDIVGEKLAPNEYEMVIPMGEDTELIAANAVEEIARRHSFDPKAINQIKTALVEAFINATEHSHSPDRKIYQKFKIEGNKITITISNRGVRLTDKKPTEIESEEGRRGWGLKLMRTLMDEVKLEQVDDGTRISMTKYIKN
jgi:serine/threonine-protein kinase RsbW